jgi:PleD family two-component response regulator
MPQNWILLLDPFRNLLNTYRMILEGEKYSVETAVNIEKAFDQFSIRHYSVFITEYLYPLEDTCRMIQWVKQNAPETYIVMVTEADIDETTYETLFDIGLDDLLSKPYPPEKVLVHIKKGIRQRDFLLKKQEVEKQSPLDPVAQQVKQPIFNPAYFRKCLRQELKRARRHGHPLSLLLLRIPPEAMLGNRLEHFCAEVAKLLRSYTREEDLVGRENGDFGILLPETDQEGSGAVVKRLSRLIQNHPTFNTDEFLKPIAEALSFQTFTYPERFFVPESLKAVLEEINREYPRR